MLPKLNILPMVVGMDLRTAFEGGVVYRKDVLAIPADHYPKMFATAAYNARALAIELSYTTKETIVPLVAKAFRGAMALSISAAIPTKENITILLAKADSQMLAVASASGFKDDAITARLNMAAAAAKAAPKAEPEKKPEQKVEIEEDEKVSEEDAAAGLSALFG
jgi:large subunit ribosomal protein L10